MKNIRYIIFSLLVAIILGTISMIAVYSLPINTIRQNVLESIEIFEIEDDGYYWAPGISSTHLDNFTDSIMINNAAFIGTGSVINDAMNNPRVEYLDAASKSECLIRAITQDTLENAVVVNYSRYWHGYLIWLKPLLMFLNLSDIRILGMIFQFILMLWFFIEIYKIDGYRLVIPFGIGVLCLNPISTAVCMQYACMFNITFIAALIMIKSKFYLSNKYWHLFLWIGIATSFFDFLTYPVVGLGINLILMILLGKKQPQNNIKKIFVASVVWCLGYGGMWAGKWLISYFLTGNNTVMDGINALKYRSSSNDIENSFFGITKLNLIGLINKPLVIVVIIMIIIIVILMVYKKYVFSYKFNNNIPLVIIGCYPFVWYAVIRNHSAIHYWMTFRNLSITIIAFACIIIYGIRRLEYK